jgi:hypothetical protein
VPSFGIASSHSASVGFFLRSMRLSRLYSSADKITTASLTCLVTVWGSMRAAPATSLKRFLASWIDQEVRGVF